jgi:nitroreductase
MSANAFRSHFMQQFAATAARTQHRPPPIALRTSHFHSAKSKSPDNNDTSRDAHQQKHQKQQHQQQQKQQKGMKDPNSLRSHSYYSTTCNNKPPKTSSKPPTTSTPEHLCRPFSTTTIAEEGEEDDNTKLTSQSFQTMLKTRRTTTRFLPLTDLTASKQQQIQDALHRAVECAIQAPNHYRTEPTTYYRIMPNTESWEKLINIAFHVALSKNASMTNKTEEESRMNAERKRDKWRDTIGGYIVVCVGGQPDQDEEEEEEENNDFNPLPIRPPETERQMEDYASACASIQNILLALHSEGLGAKWATGPIPRCRAMRELVGCQNNDLIAGLIMVGMPKLEPKQWRRRRLFEDNVFQDL